MLKSRVTESLVRLVEMFRFIQTAILTLVSLLTLIHTLSRFVKTHPKSVEIF